MKYIFMLLSLITMNAYAAPAGQWQCLAFDAKEQSYQGFGVSISSAMQAATERCRKESSCQDCKSAQSYCEQGALTLADDRCVVTDENGRAWDASGVNACKVAMSLCTEWQFLHGKTSPCSIRHN
ncbi:hypothetical protein NKV53_02880 [Legionella sp. 27cVA30]|uniref:hypothetical protein n=1 Tax=Legionella TaxID=445 RepID=UPI000F8DE45F|nr:MULTISPECIES: hypothetical protein [Legionella]MCP0913313.1 hypothetical protein [Legionella sp. 27cVA30]RUR14671.1 hypothetical protein ELY10_08000 [Legionella septentrionalis]